MDILKEVKQKEHVWISLTGAGGKTTLMQRIAGFLKENGKSVLMTTTTKIQSSLFYNWQADCVFTDTSVLDYKIKKPVVVLYAEKCDIKQKLVSPSFEVLKELYGRFDYVICEADGAKHMSFKVHTERDPVIVPWNDFTFCLFNAADMNKNTADCVFGPVSFEKTDVSFLDWLLTDAEGLLKGTMPGARAIIAVNGSKTLCDRVFEKTAERCYTAFL